MVNPARLERAAYRVGVCHSIQLSYGSIGHKISKCPDSITPKRRFVKRGRRDYFAA